jgi:hypothetical protein
MTDPTKDTHALKRTSLKGGPFVWTLREVRQNWFTVNSGSRSRGTPAPLHPTRVYGGSKRMGPEPDGEAG